jgi:chromosome partitioning protein
VKYTVRHTPDRLQVCKSRFMQFVANARALYDCVVIDCNPSFSFLTECALETCSHIISPVTPDTFALRGLVALKNITEALYSGVVPEQHVIVNCYRRGAQISDVEQQLRNSSYYGSRVLNSRIPQSAYMTTPNRDEAPENPLATLAFARSGPFADEIHHAIEEAANELAGRITIRSA